MYIILYRAENRLGKFQTEVKLLTFERKWIDEKYTGLFRQPITKIETENRMAMSFSIEDAP